MAAPPLNGQVHPTSFAQQRLWFLDRLEPDTAVYNLARALQLTGPVDCAALAKALQVIVRRHESLRSTFTLQDEDLKQVVLPALKIELPVSDLRHLPRDERLNVALTNATEEARKSFDLTAGPLLRVRMFRVESEEHILLLVVHHIIMDGWSFGVFFDELSELYTSFTFDRDPDLPALSVQYSDFARWQRETLRDDTLAAEIDYWKQKLRGADTVLDLPVDRPRPLVRSGKGNNLHFSLDEATTHRLKQFAQSEGATLAMVLLGAFQALLWRYTSQDSILVGMPVAGRRDVQLEKLMGFFVNTLVLRSDFSGDLSFRQLLRQVRSNTLESLEHQDLPFERLVEELAPPRTINRTPLFQAMFVFQNAPRSDLRLSGVASQELEFESGSAKFDLTLEVDPRPRAEAREEHDGLYYTLEYDSDLFEESTIRRFAAHLKNLVGALLAQPDKRMAQLSFLSEQELRQMLEWNDTGAEYPRDTCIHALFEQQADRTPEAIALIVEEKHLSYKELNDHANQLAGRLIRSGVRPGDLVGISMGRSLEMVVGLLGILKAGAAYVPLDPANPKDRLLFMLKDSQVRAVLTSNESRTLYDESTPERIVLDVDLSSVEEGLMRNPAIALGAESRAYVIYTSGSSGAPKGVEGTHRASINRFAWMWRTYPFGERETCCQKTNLGFVDSVWEIFGPLLAGVPNVIVPEEASADPEALVEVLAKHEVTRIVLVPSLLRVLLEHVPDLRFKLPQLNLWISSGEVLPAELAQRFLALVPQAKLLNIYGSTEIAADVAWHQVEANDCLSVPIGRPISNTQLHILDRNLNRVPVGIWGEICVGGDCLARGYWGAPELTAARFLSNPLEPGPSDRLYRTGDFARRLPDGRLEYIGRIDGQVKIRGIRIELGEIEAALSSHPSIKSAVTVVTDAAPEQQQLVAYLTGRTERELDGSELRRFLRGKLPEYMIPSAYHIVDQFPLLPGGKIDRRTLASESSVGAIPGRRYVPPKTEIEEKLVQIWGEVLRADRVGTEDNFFELGGHSLMVIQVIARIRNVFDVDIPVRSLFDEPTISGLAPHVREAQAKGVKPRIPALVRRTATHGPDRQALLAQLESLSDDETRKLLKQLSQAKSPLGSNEP